METALQLGKHALLITAFVSVMMLLIEYLNVLTSGSWQAKLTQHRWGQYVLAAFLGAIPGCLGPFAIVAMFSHGMVGFGALVAAMVATSGDESFVMFAMIPGKAFQLTAFLFLAGIVAGVLADLVVPRSLRVTPCCDQLHIHDYENCRCFRLAHILDQWRHCSPERGAMVLALLAFSLGVASGQFGPSNWNWIRVTLLFVSALALFIVATVPDHFLRDHLWQHVFLTHVPRILLWTLGALALMHLLTEQLHLEHAINSGKWVVLVAACLTGLIPESGPHLVFVTLYAQGTIPLSILVASSIVQDGHGMLPVLAHSKKQFIIIKTVNFAIGIAVGAVLMVFGY